MVSIRFYILQLRNKNRRKTVFLPVEVKNTGGKGRKGREGGRRGEGKFNKRAMDEKI